MNNKKSFTEALFDRITGCVIAGMLLLLMILGITIMGPGNPAYEALVDISEYFNQATYVEREVNLEPWEVEKPSVMDFDTFWG